MRHVLFSNPFYHHIWTNKLSALKEKGLKYHAKYRSYILRYVFISPSHFVLLIAASAQLRGFPSSFWTAVAPYWSMWSLCRAERGLRDAAQQTALTLSATTNVLDARIYSETNKYQCLFSEKSKIGVVFKEELLLFLNKPNRTVYPNSWREEKLKHEDF